MTMKKFINNPDNITAELLEGLALANPKILEVTDHNLIINKGLATADRVTIVTIGGAGHEPALEGFVGEGMIDISVVGDIFAAPGYKAVVEALKLAEEAGLDLVKIAPTAKPPVCKIVDYGKYRYELARKEKDAKRKQKVIEVKEIRMSPNIDTNDLNTKVGAARKFLEKGNRVKVTLRFRGREMAHMSTSKHILDDFAQMLSDIAVVEKIPKVEGRSMIMFLTVKR